MGSFKIVHFVAWSCYNEAKHLLSQLDKAQHKEPTPTSRKLELPNWTWDGHKSKDATFKNNKHQHDMMIIKS